MVAKVPGGCYGVLSVLVSHCVVAKALDGF